MDTVIGVIITLGGVGMLIIGIFYVIRSQKSLGWLRTDGTILSSNVVHTVHGTSNCYTPTVEYTYHVDSRDYTGETIDIGPIGTLPWLAKNKVNQYREGRRVYVYYNPQDPSDAVLEPGLKSGTYVLLAVCFLLVIVGIAQLRAPFLHINL